MQFIEGIDKYKWPTRWRPKRSHILSFAHHPYIQVNQVREDFNHRQQTMKKCQWIDLGIHIPIAEVIYNITHQTS